MRTISKPSSITFYNVKGKHRCKRMYTSHDFFYKPFTYIFKDNVLYFKHRAIDYQGKILQACRINDHLFETVLIGEWPIGTFYVDSDSTQDELIIDFNNPVCEV